MSDPFLLSPADVEAFHAQGRTLRAGVLTNPLSGGNKNGEGRAVRDVLSRWPEVLQHDACTPAEIAAALHAFAEKKIELLVINGGDGTIQAVLTILHNEKPFSHPPLLALLHAGTTSMLPRDVGVAGGLGDALVKILEWAQSERSDLNVQTRHILRVERAGESSQCGMFFGAGAITQGIRIFHGTDNPKGRRGQLMPAITILRLLLAIRTGNRKQLKPLVTRTSLDGDAPVQRSDTFALISTLDRLFLGMRPYWGKEDGPLRYTAVAYKPKRLMRVMFSLLRGLKSPHAIPKYGYTSHNPKEVCLEMDGEFTLDGELFDAGAGQVSVTAAGPALFLCSA